MKFVKGNSGSILLGVMLVSVILGASVIYLTQNTEILVKSSNHSVNKIRENTLKDSVQEYFSSRRYCESNFKNVMKYSTLSGLEDNDTSTLTATKDELKEILRNNDDYIDFEIDSIVPKVGATSTSADGDIVKATATLTLKPERSGMKALSYSALAVGSSKYPKIDLVFEFYKDGAAWNFFSCYSNNAISKETSEASCAELGGTMNTTATGCIFETLQDDLQSPETINDLKDNLCKLEMSILKHQVEPHNPLNIGANKLSTKYCPKTDWGGCNTPSDNAFYLNSSDSVLAHNKPGSTYEKYIGKKPKSYLTSTGPNTLNDLFSTSTNVRLERVVYTAGQAGIDLATFRTNAGVATSNPGGWSNADKFAAGVALTSVSAAFYGTAGLLGPVGLLGGIVIATLLKCDDKRKVYAEYVCVNGGKELDRVRLYKKKFKCKKWSCKCRWRKETTIEAPTQEELAEFVTTNASITLATFTQETTPDYSSVDETGAPLAPAANTGEMVDNFKAEADYDNWTTLDIMYNKIAELAALDANDDSVEQEEDEMIPEVADLIKDKEIELWSGINTSINNLGSALTDSSSHKNDLTTLKNIKTSSFDLHKSKLEEALASDTTTPVETSLKNKEDEIFSSMYTNMSTVSIVALTTSVSIQAKIDELQTWSIPGNLSYTTVSDKNNYINLYNTNIADFNTALAAAILAGL